MSEFDYEQRIKELEADVHLLMVQRDAIGEEVKEQAKTIAALEEKLLRIKAVLDGK